MTGSLARPLSRVAGALGRRTEDVAQIRPQRRRTTGGPRDLFLLTGWYGTETVGDQAILAGVLEVVETFYGGEIVVASLEPDVTVPTLRDLGASTRVRTVSYAEAASLIEDGRPVAVAMAGGPVMGTIEPIVDLARLHRAARARGIPDGFLGVGVGPLGRYLRRKLMASLLRDATCVTVRDEESRRNVESLCGRHVAVSHDPASIWLADGVERGLSRSGADAQKVGVALRRWPLHEFARGRATLEDRDRLEAEFRAFLHGAAERGTELEPIAMGFVAIGGDDRAFFAEMAPELFGSERWLHDRPAPESVLAKMAGCRVLVGMRFHACLFALAAGIPVVAIDYTLGGKIAGLAEQFPGRIEILDPLATRASDIWQAVDRAPARIEPDLDRRRGEARAHLSRCVEMLLASAP